MTTRQPPEPALRRLAQDLDRLLAVADAEYAAGYPGAGRGRQPVHTAYVPAHRFGANTIRLWGSEALAALDEFAAGPAEFATAFNLSADVATDVLPLVQAKLATEPIEDLRIDFEDGYGLRSDATEDAHARAAAQALRTVLGADSAPVFSGLRCKSLEPKTRARAIATVAAFLAELGDNPSGLIITLPKVTSAAQVTAMNLICERLAPAAYFEIQVELPQLIVGADGTAAIAKCVQAGAGRLIGLHYGTYDYSAAVGVSAAYQSLDHPAADHAKAVMQVAAAGTGVRVCDGATNILPVGTRSEVLRAWQLHARLVRRSLERGCYQGWDLHPAQLVSRYAATYAFYRDGLSQAATRFRSYADRAAAGLEEPATGRALAAYLLRALDCGAVAESDLIAQTGVDRAQLRSRHAR